MTKACIFSHIKNQNHFPPPISSRAVVILVCSPQEKPEEGVRLVLDPFWRRIRAVSLKGTCAIILARPVSRTAPGGVHRRGALPLIQPKPRPRVAAVVSPPPRPQPRAAWAGAFPDAPPPWAPLTVPAPVAPPPRAPQMPGLSRIGAPLPSPTPHVNITERPPQPPLR